MRQPQSALRRFNILAIFGAFNVAILLFHLFAGNIPCFPEVNVVPYLAVFLVTLVLLAILGGAKTAGINRRSTLNYMAIIILAIFVSVMFKSTGLLLCPPAL